MEPVPETDLESSEPRVQDSRKRSLLKGLTWRITATTTTFLIALATAWWFDRPFDEALKIAGSVASVEFVLKLFVYYIHERAWTFVQMR